MSVTSNFFIIDTKNKLIFKGLKDENDNYINNATVTGDLKDITGNEIESNINFSATGSGGNYEGQLSASTSLKENATYILYLKADRGSGNEAMFRIKRVAEYIDL